MNQNQPIVVPPTDPKAGYLAYRDEINAAVHRVLDSGWYILGKEVEAFEQEFATYMGAKHGIGVASGTDALEFALRACGVGSGDLVFTVSHTATATVAAIELVGATPVLVDIDPTTFTMDPESLKAVLSNSLPGKPKAIIPVHLYGHPANMPPIIELAQRYGLYVIEDCAQSHGAMIEDRMTGTWGDIGAFSFYPTKNLGALGDGGLIATDNASLAEQVRLLQQYGWKERYISDIPGGNSRLDELQAAILRVKLHHLNSENERRREIAQIYNTLLADTELTLPKLSSNIVHIYHQYVVCLPQRDALRTYLRQEGVGTLIHYPVPVHLQPAYQTRLPKVASLSCTEQVVRQILSLPMFPQMTDNQVRYICEKIIHFYK